MASLRQSALVQVHSARDRGIPGAVPEPGKPQGSPENRQELAAHTRAAVKIRTGPGVSVATYSHKGQPWGVRVTWSIIEWIDKA